MKSRRPHPQQHRKKRAPTEGFAEVSPAPAPRLGLTVSVCIFLVIMVWAVFGQTIGFEFVNYDDPANVTDNPAVIQGLSWSGVAWAFTHPQVGHWDPLTTISHMAVCHVFGLDPSGHHLVNVVLHGASTILLFLVIQRMTSAFWRSAFVAAVFAVHPLRVESVAWITERKDVLSGLFFLLTLWTYVEYVRQPAARGRYLAVIGLFALGLMCKAMLVTLPAVLLLLDFWPLRRMSGASPSETVGRLFREKAPLFALAAIFCVVQLAAAQEMIASVEKMPLLWRVENAALSYLAYVGQTFFPGDLAVFYPHPKGSLSGGAAAVAVVLLVFVSVAAWRLRSRAPYVFVGWFWFLGMLVPVIGLVQSGTLARADRYTYLPHVGLSLLVAWGAVELCAGLGARRRWVLGGAAAAAVLAMVSRARLQASYWKDSQTLWTHALESTGSNEVAECNLGHILLRQGMLDEAEIHTRKALEIAPRHEIAHNNLGMCLLAKGHVTEAIAQFQSAVGIKPKFAEAHANLGTALVNAGRRDEAITHFAAALEIAPDRAGFENNLAGALLLTGRAAQAIAHYEKAAGKAPHDVGPLRNLAWVLATCPDAALRDGRRAVELAERAQKISHGGDAMILATLAAAYAEAGRFPEAVEAARAALRPPAPRSAAATDQIRKQLELYESHTPYREGYEVKP